MNNNSSNGNREIPKNEYEKLNSSSESSEELHRMKSGDIPYKGKNRDDSFAVTKYTLILATVWTLVIGLSFWWNCHQEQEGSSEVMRVAAREQISKDILHRRWNAEHGGVYVPVTESTPPNPYLTQVKERDIETPSGRRLTLINPAYMTRQVHELGLKTMGVRGHITSLNPIRPGNAPDDWEKGALESFDKGNEEFSSIEILDNGPNMRLMKPLVTEQGCLKCHSHQGYQLGDIRGGISVSMPIVPYAAITRNHITNFAIGHALFWLLGLFGLGFSTRRIKSQIEVRKRAEKSLKDFLRLQIDIINFLPDPTMVIDADGVLIAWNHAIENLTDFKTEDMVGKGDYEYALPFYGKRRPLLIDIALNPTDELRKFYPHILQKGDKFISNKPGKYLGNDAYLVSIAGPLYSSKGEIIGAIQTIHDVTEQKQAEEQISELKEFNEAIINNLSEGIVLENDEGIIKFANPAMLQMLGYEDAELVGDHWNSFVPEDQIEIVKNANKRREKGESDQYEMELLKKDGSRIHVIVGGVTHIQENKYVGLLASFTDITEHKRAEDALRESEERFRNLMEYVPGISIQGYDLRGTVLYWNKASEEVYGYTAREALGKNLADLIIPDDVMPLFKKALEVGKIIKKSGEFAPPGEVNLLHKNGSLTPIYSIHTAVKSPGKDPILFCIDVDLSERKKKEEALKDKEEILRNIFEHSTNVYYSHTPDHIITYLSPQIKDVIGYEVDEALIRWTELASDNPVNEKGFELTVKAIETANPQPPYELELVHKDGRKIRVEVRESPVVVDGKTVSIVGSLTDITQSKRAEVALRESEERFKHITESAMEWIWEVDKNGLYTYSSHVVEDILGWKPDEIVGKKHFYDFFEPETKEEMKELALSAFKEKLTLFRLENINQHRDGRKVVLETNGAPIIGNNGELIGYRGADIDITKRTRAEEELRVNEARYRNLFENSPVALWEQDYSEIYNYCSELEQSGVTDLEEYLSKYPEELFKCANLIKIKDVNKASLTLYKAKTKVELLESINNVFTEETLPVFKESLLAIASGKKFFQSEVALQSLDKKKLFCDLTWSVSDRRVITSTLNITERKLVAEALKKSEDKYRNLFETSLVGIYRSRIEDGKVLAANSACAEIFGYDSVDSFVQDFSASKHYQDNHQREQLLHELERSGKVDGFEFTAVRKDGSNFDAAISVTIYPDKGYLEGVLFDITERKRAEEERLESESKFRSVIEQSNDAIYILFNDKFDLINNRFTEITGITVEETKAPDFNFMDSVAPKDRPLIEERSQMWERGERPPDVYEFTVVHKNGKHNQVQASVNEIDYHDYKAYLGILRDISEKKILEGQLHQAQKMESIGHLAGGIAHDFNNLLTPILGNIELIQMDLKVEDSLYLELEEIRNAAERAADLTRQLLAFSRKQVMEFKIFNLNKLISGFMRILRRTIREDVDIKTFYDNSISSIEGDPTQIEQILMNLCVNSQHAMPNGGKITIETGAVEFDEEYVRTHEGAEKGFYVMLSVSDTGTGIDSNTIDKVFDPFFTTKKVGEGTGMGLATVYGIVKQHRGTIRVYSEPGHGTTFKVYFRASEKVAGERMEANSRKAAGGFETVMVVEDNELVRKLAVRILKAHGYNVIEVSNPDEAIEVAQDKTVKLDVLLTDVIMPKMNGRELFENVAKTQLKMKVIYMSGYTKNAIAHHGVLNKGITFLQKPFTIESLIRKIQEVLEK